MSSLKKLENFDNKHLHSFLIFSDASKTQISVSNVIDNFEEHDRRYVEVRELRYRITSQNFRLISRSHNYAKVDRVEVSSRPTEREWDSTRCPDRACKLPPEHAKRYRARLSLIRTRIACIPEITPSNFFAKHVTRLLGNNAETGMTAPDPRVCTRIRRRAHVYEPLPGAGVKVATTFRSLLSLRSYPSTLCRRFITGDKIREFPRQTKADATRSASRNPIKWIPLEVDSPIF